MKGSCSSAALRRARHRVDGYILATSWRRLATTSHQHAPHQGSSHCQQHTPHPSGSVQMLPATASERRGSPTEAQKRAAACVHGASTVVHHHACGRRATCYGQSASACGALGCPRCAMVHRVRGRECGISDQIKWPMMSASTPAHEWHCHQFASRTPCLVLGPLAAHQLPTRMRLHRPQPSL